MKPGRLENLANISIALAGVSVGFMHALYGVSTEPTINFWSFIFLSAGLPFLITTWSNARKYVNSGPNIEIHAKVVRAINASAMFGIFSTIAGILLFLYSWHWFVAAVALVSFFMAITSGPFFDRIQNKMARAQNIKNIRNEKTANKAKH